MVVETLAIIPRQMMEGVVMAAVAETHLGSVSLIQLVPLLPMCNHQRGGKKSLCRSPVLRVWNLDTWRPSECREVQVIPLTRLPVLTGSDRCPVLHIRQKGVLLMSHITQTAADLRCPMELPGVSHTVPALLNV